MTERKFTPGPWHQVDYAGQFEIQDGPMYEDRNLLMYFNHPLPINVSKEEAESNAKLMCAAPDLLNALCAIVDTLEDSVQPDDNPLYNEIQAAIETIKKATE